MSSRFTASKTANEQELYEKVILELPKEVVLQVDINNCQLIEPYEGKKEILIRNLLGKEIAYASISESHSNYDEWSVYLDY
tara:strand:+ start:549 stop:791 length:243 start_codon:yes stop_codon:yes gene_type:complete